MFDIVWLQDSRGQGSVGVPLLSLGGTLSVWAAAIRQWWLQPWDDNSSGVYTRQGHRAVQRRWVSSAAATHRRGPRSHAVPQSVAEQRLPGDNPTTSCHVPVHPGHGVEASGRRIQCQDHRSILLSTWNHCRPLEERLQTSRGTTTLCL